MQNILYLILGGQASGKTARGLDLAEKLSQQLSPVAPLTYIATAVALDDEMKKKATAHAAERQARQKNWQTMEEATALDKILSKPAAGVVVIDSLAFWLFNIINQKKNSDDEIEKLLRSLNSLQGHVVVVSDEINFSPVAGDVETRLFCRALGGLHQRVAVVATHVELMVAGIPHKIK